MARNWPDGIGEALGDSLVVNAPFQTGSDVWYVHHTGSDAYNGRDRAKPFATIKKAVDTATAGDTIVCLDGHTETVTAQTVFDVACLTLVGAGSSGGLPTVKVTPGPALGTDMWVVTNPFASIRNIWFNANTADAAFAKIVLNTSVGDASAFHLKDCYFQQGAHDTGSALKVSNVVTSMRLEGNTFVSTATAVTAQPLVAVLFVHASICEGVVMEDTVFDSGADGFSNFYAFDSSGGGGIVFRFERLSLLNGADMKFKSTDVGILNVGTAQGGARVDW